jgi:hypothetical protein
MLMANENILIHVRRPLPANQESELPTGSWDVLVWVGNGRGTLMLRFINSITCLKMEIFFSMILSNANK